MKLRSFSTLNFLRMLTLYWMKLEIFHSRFSEREYLSVSCLNVLKLCPFSVLGTDIADECANPINIVGQTDYTEKLNENQTNCLLFGHCCDVPETNSQHYVGSPIIRPNILLRPMRIVYIFQGIPIVLGVNLSHSVEQNCEDVGEAKVEKEDFDERPILFIIVALYEVHL